MEVHLLTRAVSRCNLASSRSRLLRSSPIQLHQCRHKATTNRTKRALNIPPHSSFLTPEPQDHIIFNPPSSAASVYHTPFKFLPKSDPRRRANLNMLFESSTTLAFNTSTDATTTELPPRVNHEYYTADKYHLTKEDVAEIRRLRVEDPVQWSTLKLARKFNCSPLFVMMLVREMPNAKEVMREHREAMKGKIEAVKARWGPIRTKARVDRRRRKDMILAGEI